MTFRDQDFHKENIIYRNVDHFAQWLASVLKTFDGSAQSLTVYLGDLAEAYAVSNEEYFEIRGFYTKSGNLEGYSFKVQYQQDEDGEIIQNMIL